MTAAISTTSSDKRPCHQLCAQTAITKTNIVLAHCTWQLMHYLYTVPLFNLLKEYRTGLMQNYSELQLQHSIQSSRARAILNVILPAKPKLCTPPPPFFPSFHNIKLPSHWCLSSYYLRDHLWCVVSVSEPENSLCNTLQKHSFIHYLIIITVQLSAYVLLSVF